MKKLAAISFLLTGFVAVRGQNNYSTNTVGFCLLHLPSNQPALFANQFNTPSNVISSLLSNAPAGSAFCKSPSGWPLSVSGPSGWSTDMPLNPGEAGFLTPSAPMQVTFCGSVPQGYATNLLPQGVSAALSSMAPISGYLSSQMSFPACPGDVVGLCSSNGISYSQFNSSWSPGEPYLPPGQGFIFMDSNALQPAPVPISPDTSGQSATPYYTFYSVPVATSYTIYLWDYANATNTVYGPLTPAQVDFGTPGQSRFLQSAPLHLGTYTWVVSASNEEGTSPWSDYMTFTVGDVPPAPVPIGPGSQAAPYPDGQSATPYYTFYTVAGATSYSLFLWDYATLTGTNYGPLTPAQVDFGTPGQGRFLQPGPLALGAYTWIVNASNASGWSPWSAYMTFIVGQAPPAPVPISPGSQATPYPDGQSATPYYTFYTVAAATSYTIFLWDYATPSSTVFGPLTPVQVDFGTPGQGRFLQPTALDLGTYTWVVNASNGAGTSPWSSYMTFTVGPLPYAPVPTVPDMAGQSATRDNTFDTIPGAAGSVIVYSDPILTGVYAAAEVALENLTGVGTIGRASPNSPGLQTGSDQAGNEVGAGLSSPVMTLGAEGQMQNQNQNQGRAWVQNISTQPYPDSGTVGLTITQASTNTFTLSISGAPSGNTYYIMSNIILGSTNTAWNCEATISGNSSATISANNRTTLFLVAVNQHADSDGDGVPDWWMMQYFGHPTGQGDISPNGLTSGNGLIVFTPMK